MLTLELIAQVKGKPDFITLSEDGRWVAISYGGEQRLFDAQTGRELGRIESPGILSPDGKTTASMGNGTLTVTRSDGKQVTTTYAYPTEGSRSWDFCFTADSQRLWVTLWNEDGTGKLALLDAATLEELDAIPMPVAEDDDSTTWINPLMSLHIPSNTLALQHVYSDHWYLLGVFFFSVHENQIKQHELHIRPDSDLEIMPSTAFSAGGQRFAGIIGSYYIWFWNMTDMKGHQLWHVLDEEENDALYGERKTFQSITFIGDQLIVLVEDNDNYELRVVDIDNDREVSRHPVPPGFVFPPYLPDTMRGQTLAGIQGDDVVMYRLRLPESDRR